MNSFPVHFVILWLQQNIKHWNIQIVQRYVYHYYQQLEKHDRNNTESAIYKQIQRSRFCPFYQSWVAPSNNCVIRVFDQNSVKKLEKRGWVVRAYECQRTIDFCFLIRVRDPTDILISFLHVHPEYHGRISMCCLTKYQICEFAMLLGICVNSVLQHIRIYPRCLSHLSWKNDPVFCKNSPALENCTLLANLDPCSIHL